jgi:hypothetical protein
MPASSIVALLLVFLAVDFAIIYCICKTAALADERSHQLHERERERVWCGLHGRAR